MDETLRLGGKEFVFLGDVPGGSALLRYGRFPARPSRPPTHVSAPPLRESMKEADIEITLSEPKDRNVQPNPRIISDNGPQFIVKVSGVHSDLGLRHVGTSPFYRTW
jgi:hypothetical protein